MPLPCDVVVQLDRFLEQHCSDPDALRVALDRSSLGTVEDALPGQLICRNGEPVCGCWLVVDGQVEIRSDDQMVVFRSAGEIFGEQGLLQVLSGRDGSRTADVRAVGPVKLLRIDAAFQERLVDRDKVVWTLTLASVVNQKLAQATGMRSDLRVSASRHEMLLRRFADGDALGLVKIASGSGRPPVQSRRAIVLFSDIVGFSVWSAERPPDEVAAHLRELAGIQINAIRDAGGQVDKLMGDGAMAYWFVDSGDREKRVPAAVLVCVRLIAARFEEYFARHGLPLGLRVGLHSGDVAFGDFGAEERIAVTLLGTTVNLAARYEQAKSPELGTIRVSPDVRTLMVGGGASPEIFQGPTKIEAKHGVELDVYSIRGETHAVE
jgi:class 3 adenylate cyclase